VTELAAMILVWCEDGPTKVGIYRKNGVPHNVLIRDIPKNPRTIRFGEFIHFTSPSGECRRSNRCAYLYAFRFGRNQNLHLLMIDRLDFHVHAFVKTGSIGAVLEGERHFHVLLPRFAAASRRMVMMVQASYRCIPLMMTRSR
jgi:hypothetical protein